LISLATPTWNISGQYFEACSCDFMCPCITGQLAARPTNNGSCTFAITMQIERGSFDDVTLDGLCFIVLGYAPAEMGKGNWSVGLVIDEGATAEQREAITAIASGAAGGPMAPLSGMIGTFLGVESAAIRFDRCGMKLTVTAGDLVEMGGEGQGFDPNSAAPMFLENTCEPVSTRLALAQASESHVHALGLNWDAESGKNYGHFAPFNWRSA
jgi:hypothetical protein